MIDAKTIERELEALPESGIAMIETSAENALELGLVAARFLTSRGFTGIILSASRPYSNLMELYAKNGIPAKKVFVLDCVTKKSPQTRELENVLCVETASDLTTISLAMQKAFDQTAGKRFLFVDSITTFLIYNEPRSFARFVHFALTKARLNSISGILVSLTEGTDPEVRAEIAQLCDKIIRI